MLVAEYLYNLDMSHRLLSRKVYVCKCMHTMYDMHDPNTGAYDPNIGSFVKQNYICSLEYENNVLYQQLLNLSFKCF